MTKATSIARDHIASQPIRNVLVIARQSAGLTLADVAERADCLPNQLNNWENGRNTPGVDALARWADALGYEIALLPKAKESSEDTEPMPECVATATCCAYCLHDLGECCKHGQEADLG